MTDKEKSPDQLTMRYRCPGPHKIEGVMVDYMTTTDIAAAEADGWFATVAEAFDATQPKAAPAKQRAKK